MSSSDKRRPRKVITTLLLFLLLGAIVNVAVAWVVASTPSWRTGPDGGGMPSAFETSSMFSSNESPGSFFRREMGWPARSLKTEIPGLANVDPSEDPWRRGLQVRWGFSAVTRPLPVWPVWPGFAINTIVYAVMLWSLLALALILRRRLRLKRGLCPNCKYPIGSSAVCTECGAAVRVVEAA